jgi:hypothetical protein
MAGVRSRPGGTVPHGTNCTLNQSRVNTLEIAAPRRFSADGPVGSVVPIGAGTAFALGTGNENPGQF